MFVFGTLRSNENEALFGTSYVGISNFSVPYNIVLQKCFSEPKRAYLIVIPNNLKFCLD